ncbi:DNA translocase FtsK [Mesorhizobium sp. 1B3]|uniref:DNA translocase FtsK n=1 Tax=Mesorhizobium sp. 1B3 TaxID=3243599 RepID=UPI003D971D47
MKPKGNTSTGEALPNRANGHFSRDTWQDYFFLAPNVRFTRTPDRELKKEPGDAGTIQGESRTDRAARTPPTPEASPTPRPAPAPTSPTGLLETLRSSLAANRLVETPLVARASSPVSAGPATDLPASAPLTARAAPQVERQREDKAPAPVVTENKRWSYLSDFAFFEGVSLDAIESVSPIPVTETTVMPAAVPAVATVAEPIAPVSVKPVEPPSGEANEITSLYRVIECHSGAGGFLPQAEAVSQSVVSESSEPAAEVTVPDALQEAQAEDEPVAQPAPALKDIATREPESRRVVDMNLPVPAARPPSTTLRKVGVVVQPGAVGGYELPSEELLQQPPEGQGFYMSQERLEQNADLLESVLEDFGVRGEIIHVRPGPVVTLYEFEPAPGVKSSRVIGLADDIARSMSAISARVAVVPGRNVIGIELPNETRETVYFRELIESDGFRKTSCKLALCLGKTIGGEPVIAELAKMPHLLVAGTTGSGKSVAINTMILSLLYRLKPEECRLIMVDPKMLELSVYDGIPHLLTPVVTDPKKAVTALKWAVREMEDRYRKMARLGVRNIDGYNQRAAAARDKGEPVLMTVQTGFEQGTGEPLFEEQEVDLAPMPYIVVIVDEMADLMMVAGKEIEGAIQRLAQMARAAGIHLIMATQRPSVDVITGTIKANFPTRISFQVTSKIDSRTILGEQGAEQLLGQGDMLHMAGGGRIVRVHGPFVSDEEVEQVVAHLKMQGRPEYLETVTADEEEEEAEADQGPVFDKGAVAADDGDAIYEQAVKVVLRDKKCSTSYIQRRLGIGYNRAASLVERMEKEGLVGAPNHVGKREILSGRREPGDGD